MRVVASVMGILVFAILITGGVALAHRQAPAHAPTLTGSRQVVTVVANGPGVDPPHVIPPPPPPPSPTAPPANPSTGGAAPARATGPALVVRTTQQALINSDRAASGLAPLTWNNCLYSVALSNARRIAAERPALGYISHTNGPQADLSCGLGYRAGENIGDWSLGVNDAQLNSMFMASPDHRANILGPYHYVATAWVVGSDGWGYIAVEFS